MGSSIDIYSENHPEPVHLQWIQNCRIDTRSVLKRSNSRSTKRLSRMENRMLIRGLSYEPSEDQDQRAERSFASIEPKESLDSVAHRQEVSVE